MAIEVHVETNVDAAAHGGMPDYDSRLAVAVRAGECTRCSAYSGLPCFLKETPWERLLRRGSSKSTLIGCEQPC